MTFAQGKGSQRIPALHSKNQENSRRNSFRIVTIRLLPSHNKNVCLFYLDTSCSHLVFSAVKLEVVLSNNSVSNPAEQMVMNTMKHGLDITTRLKLNNTGAFEEGSKVETGSNVAAADFNSSTYNIDRTNAIMRSVVLIFIRKSDSRDTVIH